jgi:DNA-binding CsgD family transcriptional regulator
MTGMGYIHVIIADLSPLTRLGLTTLLNHMKYPFHIREISTPDKLSGLTKRELGDMLIISCTFLQKCSPVLIHRLQKQFNSNICILIFDSDNFPEKYLKFAEIIEYTDHDKTIIRKLERQLNVIYHYNPVQNTSEEISDREKDVLRLVAIGLTNKEIGDKLFISSHTVITHRKNITAKLGIKTIAGLTMYALINHLIIPEEIN